MAGQKQKHDKDAKSSGSVKKTLQKLFGKRRVTDPGSAGADARPPAAARPVVSSDEQLRRYLTRNGDAYAFGALRVETPERAGAATRALPVTIAAPSKVSAKPRSATIYTPKTPRKDSAGNTNIIMEATSEKPCGFLRLPGEVRNQIYGYLYHETLATIRRDTPWPLTQDCPLLNAKREHQDSTSPKRSKILRITFKKQSKRAKVLDFHRIPGRQPFPIKGINWETSLSGLVLTCKLFSVEASSMMYGMTAFYFDDAQRLNAFLDTVTSLNLASIRKLYVHVRAFGIPSTTADMVWEEKHINRWTSTFAKIAAKMVNLGEMHITLSMKDMTAYLRRTFTPLSNGEDWMERAGPILMLQPLSSLEPVTIKLKIRCPVYEAAHYPQKVSKLFIEHYQTQKMWPHLALQDKVNNRYYRHLDGMHRTLTQAMVDVARSVDAEHAFAPVIVEVSEYREWIASPILNCLRADEG